MKQKYKDSLMNMAIFYMAIFVLILLIFYIIPHNYDLFSNDEEEIQNNTVEYINYSIKNMSFNEFKGLYKEGKIKPMLII